MEQFYNDWHNNSNYWFNSNKDFDKYLSDKYGYLIDEITDNNIYQILIYDQLTRHYYRDQYANHIINYFNRKALKIAIKIDLSSLNYNDWMFVILVFRHSNERKHLLFAMEQAWKRGSKQFLKATYNRANFKEELELNYKNPSNFNHLILENYPYKNILYTPLTYLGDFSELPNYNNNPIIVSLSGGVDSICCLYSIAKIFDFNRIVAVHINYNNRPETKDECNFLKSYCNELNVKLYIRHINEIQRKQAIDNDMREVYETYTKKVRFNSYKRAFELEGGIGMPIVILGHNKDDCFENILTNIVYKNKYDNLNGIDILTIINDIIFYRPIINIPKSEIYKYANNHNLPYLNNSTPNWCQRGKIRTMVTPILKKWDNKIIDGLFNLSDILKDLHINLYLNVKELKIENVSNIDNLNTSLLFWKYGIFNIFNFYPSNKSLNCLIERLKLFKLNYNFKEINKKTKIIINKNLYLSIWKSKIINQINYNFLFISDNNNN